MLMELNVGQAFCRLFLFDVLLVLLISGLNVCAQPASIQFQRLDMSNGLSHHMVNDIYQDDQGFMWFATSSGLNRYDGYTIRVFRNSPADTTSLVADDIRQIFEGPNRQLWILTNAGNAVYDFESERFHRNTGNGQTTAGLAVAPGILNHQGTFRSYLCRHQSNSSTSWHGRVGC